MYPVFVAAAFLLPAAYRVHIIPPAHTSCRGLNFPHKGLPAVANSGPSDIESMLEESSAPRSTRARDSSATDWETLISALRLYHAKHGDLTIDAAWRVPDEGNDEDEGVGHGGGGGGGGGGWPAQLRGVKLARLVYDLSFWKDHLALTGDTHGGERRAELLELGFIWGRLQPEFNLVVEALLCYKEQHGDLLVPLKFKVPAQEPWPMSCWKLPLGARVSAIRNRYHHVGVGSKGYTQRWYQLNEMGFVWDSSELEWERLHSALACFREMHGHCLVPRTFVVPPNNGPTKVAAPDAAAVTAGSDEWPAAARGLKLGVAVSNLRNKRSFLRDHPQRLAQLQALGFVWDPSAHTFGLLVQSLEHFKRLHGHAKVPCKFVVPADGGGGGGGGCALSFDADDFDAEALPPGPVAVQPPWPRDTWAFPLGRRVATVRSRGDLVKSSPGRRDRLNALGFDWGKPRAVRPKQQPMTKADSTAKQTKRAKEAS